MRGNWKQDHWEREGVAMWRKMTFLFFTQINMIFFPLDYTYIWEKQKYRLLRIVSLQCVLEVLSFFENVYARFNFFSIKSFPLTSSVAAPIFVKHWVFPLLEWPLLLFNWVFSFDLGLPEALWPEDGRLTAVDVDCLLCPLKMLTDSVRIVHTFLNIAKNIPLHRTTPVF